MVESHFNLFDQNEAWCVACRRGGELSLRNSYSSHTDLPRPQIGDMCIASGASYCRHSGVSKSLM
ncbi:hypothetical protein CPL00345_CDS0070 [Klebsiella phage GlastoCabaret]